MLSAVLDGARNRGRDMYSCVRCKQRRPWDNFGCAQSKRLLDKKGASPCDEARSGIQADRATAMPR
jgi:hypothetical protein